MKYNLLTHFNLENNEGNLIYACNTKAELKKNIIGIIHNEFSDCSRANGDYIPSFVEYIDDNEDYYKVAICKNGKFVLKNLIDIF